MMNRYHLIMLGLLVMAGVKEVQATKDTISHYFLFNQVKPRDTLFVRNFYTAQHVSHFSYPRAYLKKAHQVLSLYVQPTWGDAWKDQKYTARLSGYLLAGPKDHMDTLRFSLSVDYDISNAQSYKAKDVIVRPLTEAGAFTILVIEQLGIFNSQDQPVSVDVTDMVFRLGNQIQYENGYQLREGMLAYNSPLTYTIDAASKTINCRWRKLSYSEYYDFEWCFVDNYKGTSTDKKTFGELFTGANREYVDALKKQSARVSITDTFYTLPLTFESGYLLVRSRAIGTGGQNYDQPVYGHWREQIIDLTASGAGLFTNDKMNWQYQALFSDDGKRKDVVSFLDGTLRERQSLISLNTDKNVLVSESVYDHQGRPAVQILPAPVLSGSPALQYYGNFNVSTLTNNAYSRVDFDTTSEECGSPTPAGLKNTNGAGKYYSSSNPLPGIHKYVPDAEGFPLVQTEYMPDPTGRIRSTGMAGINHQLGRQHQKSFEYSNSSQSELDKLFGNNIGFAGYYDKESMKDENGQMMIWYKDGKGNIVASALAGAQPPMMDALDRRTQLIQINMLDEGNIADSVAHTVTAVKNLELAVPTDLVIEYSIIGEHFKAFVPGITDSLCMDCVYDLRIQLKDACGTILFDETQTIGNINGILFQCENDGYYKKDTVSLTEPGKYALTKILTINQAAQEKYEGEYLKLQSIDIVRRPIIDGISPKAFSAECIDCVPCVYKTEIIAFADGTKATVRRKDTVAMKAPCLDHCPGNTSPCQGAYEAMLRDVSPGGQYGEYEYTDDEEERHFAPHLFPYSVFNWNNNLNRPGTGAAPTSERSWRRPVFPYQELDGTVSQVPIYDEEGVHYGRPEQLARVDSFLKYWQPSWAASLVPYHPESCYYEFCLVNENVLRYNNKVQLIDDHQEALDSSLSTLANLKNRDPLRNGPWFARFTDSLNRFFRVDAVRFLNVEQAAVALVNCLTTQMTPDQLYVCGSGTPLYDPNLTAEGKSAEWFYLQSFYLSVRRKILDEERRKFVRAKPGCITNDCIGANTFANRSFEIIPGLNEAGGNASNYTGDLIETHSLNTSCCSYIGPAGVMITSSGIVTNGIAETAMPAEYCRILRNKTRVFYDADDVFDYVDMVTLRDEVNEALYANCGKCIELYQLELLLNAFVQTGKLTTGTTWPGAPPLVIYEELLLHFEQPHGASYDVVASFDPGRRHLYLSFRPNDIPNTTVEVFGVQLSLADSSVWNRIRSISCLESKGQHSFSAIATLDDGSRISISGAVTSIDFSACKPDQRCKSTTRATDFSQFLKYILQHQNRYFAGAEPLLLPTTIGQLAINTPGDGKKSWFWRLNTFATAENTRTYNAEVLELRLTQNLLNHLRDRTPVFGQSMPFIGNRKYNQFLTNQLSKTERLMILRKIITYLDQPSTSRGLKVFLKKCSVKLINEQKDQQDISSFASFDLFELQIPNNIDSTKCKQNRAILVGSLPDNEKKSSLIVESSCFNIIECCVKKGHKPFCCLPPDALTVRSFLDSTACEDDLAEYEDIAGDRFADDIIENKLDSIRKAYFRKCFQAIERFTTNYADEIYHYTLYYYDRAGNLVKTVPPSGVDTLNTTEITTANTARRTGASPNFREHRMATIYEYNSLNQVIKTNTPDGGITLHCYDENGRLVLSQNAYHQPLNRAIYILYDAFGRIIESGECKSILRNARLAETLKYKDFADEVRSDNTRTEITQTVYDKSINATITSYFETGQEHLRNRIASIIFRRKLSGPYDHATHYSYDMNGNVKELVQEYSELARRYPFLLNNNNHIKKIQYRYDIISGKVNSIVYQKEQPDQFIHYYVYDADNRLCEVRTTTNMYEDLATIDMDASYSYYRHGPLGRMELGKDKVQGVDYAYTINGWLKVINADTVYAKYDMGMDGYKNNRVAKDVIGVSLGYFNNDYKPVGGASFATAVSTTQNPAFTSRSLYNDNISHMITANAAFMNNPAQATLYRYDQLNRLKDMQLFEKTGTGWNSGHLTEKYRNKFVYDANGNIQAQLRRDGNEVLFDTLQYQYKTNNNQLTHVLDAVPEGLRSYDIDNQQPNNYRYDAVGRLSHDGAEGLDNIEWANHHKPYFIAKNTGDTVSFTYDAMNNRISKSYRGRTTLYVKDGTGTILTTYTIENSFFQPDEQFIYTNKRLGTYKHNSVQFQNALTQKRGQKTYELTNHLDNVLSIVSDRRILAGNIYNAHVLTAGEYFPFGMEMQERNFAEVGLKFGFNGKEMDDEVKGYANSLDFENRFLDTRLGRWLSVDNHAAAYPSLSPYQSFNNNPLIFIDPTGNDATPAEFDKKQDSEPNRTSASDQRIIEKILKLRSHLQRSGKPTKFEIDPYGGLVMKIRDYEQSPYEETYLLGATADEKLDFLYLGDNSRSVNGVVDPDPAGEILTTLGFGTVTSLTSNLAAKLPSFARAATLSATLRLAAPNLVVSEAAVGGAVTTNMMSVGRWMSTAEYNMMKSSGRIVEGAGGQTFVMTGGAANYASSAPGTVYVEFQIPLNSLLQGGKTNWYKVIGPNAGKAMKFALEKQGGEMLPKVQNLSPILQSK